MELIIADRLIFTWNLRSKQKRAGTERLSIWTLRDCTDRSWCSDIISDFFRVFPHSGSPPQGPSRPYQLGKHFLCICLLFAWQGSPVCVMGRWLPGTTRFLRQAAFQVILNASETFCSQHTHLQAKISKILTEITCYYEAWLFTALWSGRLGSIASKISLPGDFCSEGAECRKTTRFLWLSPKGKKLIFTLFCVWQYDEHGWSFPLYLSCHRGFICSFIVL